MTANQNQRIRSKCWIGIVALVCCLLTSVSQAADPPPLTTLSDPTIRYSVPKKPYQVIARGDVRMVVVNNAAVDDEVLPKHRAGYNGIGSLTHQRRTENLFVPEVAGLNFEHIHDGTKQDRKILFEPRNAPLELRTIDEFTAELYQPPTSTWGLESCHRYRLLPDGAIEMTFECIPRRDTFRNGYIGLFWASYIHEPESKDIYFRGHDEGETAAATRWIRGITPAHGTRPTHFPTGDQRQFKFAPDFPLTLVFNRSEHRYTEPWYFGVSHGLAYAQIFRRQDRVLLSQSPSGGGALNPAWDFQWLIEKYQLNQRYQLVMRALYLPYKSPEQIEQLTQRHRAALWQR